jgi:hypothetical protein
LRRRPATYERILRNIEGHHITVHCTITAAMMERDSYIPEFVSFWSANPAVEKIWMSIFTPQRGAFNVECLRPGQRRRLVETLLYLGPQHPKLDMSESVIKEFLSPPESPERCIFAQTTRVISADLKTRVEPCQFGGDPDCSRCGCVASMGLAAVGHRKLVGSITAGNVFWVSAAIGRQVWAVKRKVQSVLAMRPSSSDNSGPDTKPAHGSRSLAR